MKRRTSQKSVVLYSSVCRTRPQHLTITVMQLVHLQSSFCALHLDRKCVACVCGENIDIHVYQKPGKTCPIRLGSHSYSICRHCCIITLDTAVESQCFTTSANQTAIHDFCCFCGSEYMCVENGCNLLFFLKILTVGLSYSNIDKGDCINVLCKIIMNTNTRIVSHPKFLLRVSIHVHVFTLLVNKYCLNHIFIQGHDFSCSIVKMVGCSYNWSNRLLVI